MFYNDFSFQPPACLSSSSLSVNGISSYFNEKTGTIKREHPHTSITVFICLAVQYVLHPLLGQHTCPISPFALCPPCCPLCWFLLMENMVNHVNASVLSPRHLGLFPLLSLSVIYFKYYLWDLFLTLVFLSLICTSSWTQMVNLTA